MRTWSDFCFAGDCFFVYLLGQPSDDWAGVLDDKQGCLNNPMLFLSSFDKLIIIYMYRQKTMSSLATLSWGEGSAESRLFFQRCNGDLALKR